MKTMEPKKKSSAQLKRKVVKDELSLSRESMINPCCSLNQRDEEVRKKAYELFERRGCQLGHDLDDWLEAERLVSK